MSLPKITMRATRAVRDEEDPYRFFRRGAPRVCRRVYEDGSCVLFVGDEPVLLLCYKPHYPIRHSYALLDLADGSTIHLEGVSSEEGQWLQESIRRPSQ